MSSKSTSFRTCLAVAALGLVAGGAQAQVFDVKLQGGSVVPPVQSDGSGSCTVILTDAEAHISCSHNLTDVLAAHVHSGGADANGPVVFDLGSGDPSVQDTWLIDSENRALLLAGMLYFQVHTATNPPGELRGQIIPTPGTGETLSLVQLSGDEVTPPVATSSGGACSTRLNADETVVQIDCTHDVVDPLAAHIHQGPRGGGGGVVFDLGDGTSPISANWDVGEAEVQALRNGEYYFQVHSATNPPGELRAQIDGCLADPDTLCLEGGRYSAEVTWEDFQGNTGVGTAVPEATDSGMFWFFDAANLEVLVKVLDGCAVNDRFWVFAAATTNVAYELVVTDTVLGTSKSYSNALGVSAPAVTDTDAFDSCP